jgi:putative acyl-CoA dehydrogenase
MATQDPFSNAPYRTHEVTNQAPPLVDYNLFVTDRVLVEAVQKEDAEWAVPALTALGARLGRKELLDAAVQANAYPPVLRAFDRYGNRVDQVEFHPAWHTIIAVATDEGLHTAPWADPRPGAHVARAAGALMMNQVEAGVQCPVTMTYGVVPTLRRQPELAAEWLPRLYSRRYDARDLPAAQKTGVLMGMGMTEKQGGSDLRSNSTTAEAIDSGGGPGRAYTLVGHKWFFSAPQIDAHLVLARAPGGLSCFFLPRWLPDGRKNAIHIQRLKDKLGNRSNASSEVEFHRAVGWLIGEEGRGVPNIIEMGTYTRLDCALGSTGLMRQALAQALHHAHHRAAFGRALVDQPIMANVLGDLALEVAAATVLTMRLARAFDRQEDETEAAFRRLLTPAVKYWVCKRGPTVGAECMEVLGGNGYVEDSVMPRLYREMPLNSIWEGSGNVMCLDVLRALQKTPRALEALTAELRGGRAKDPRLDRYVDALEASASAARDHEGDARRFTEQLVLALQGALLMRHGDEQVADAFITTRLERNWGGTFGTLPARVDGRALAERATPRI